MKSAAASIFLLLLAACGPVPKRYGAFHQLVYPASGDSPPWSLVVRDKSMVLTLFGGATESHSYGEAEVRTEGNTTWWTARGAEPITVEARRVPCALGDKRYEDQVTVTMGARRLTGCGGSMLPAVRG